MRAPMALAIWMAAVPTPLAPACTSAQRPLVSPPCTHQRVPRGEEHLGDGRRVDEVDALGHGEQLAFVRGDALGVCTAGLDAHHPVAHLPHRRPARRTATTVPANSRPGISGVRPRGSG